MIFVLSSVLLLHATSSVSLTLLNKALATSFPFPWTVLLFQNFTCILISVLAHFSAVQPLKRIRAQHLQGMVPVAFLYIALIWTSLLQLTAVPVSTVVVARSLLPFVTAIIERFYFQTIFSPFAYAALALIALGNVFYATALAAWNSRGLLLVTANMGVAIVASIMEKKVSLAMGEEQTPAGIVLYRNLLSIPVIVALFVSLEAGNSVDALTNYLANTKHAAAILGTSCFFSYAIGNCIFYLQREVNTTTIATANNCYKLLTLICGLILWPIPLSNLAVVGIGINFVGVFWYSWLQTKRPVSASGILRLTSTAVISAGPGDDRKSEHAEQKTT